MKVRADHIYCLLNHKAMQIIHKDIWLYLDPLMSIGAIFEERDSFFWNAQICK